MVLEGMTNQQIAAKLVVSVRTVESHLHRAMRKVGVSSRHDLSEQLGSLIMPGS
ncbi:helix-turn-helix domain-containing protein [Leucobacter insecticola]|nr:helix-turn-helix transcriptional regulator [Leucobacter insecticola]